MIWVVILLATATAVFFLAKRGGVTELPFGFAAVYLGWVAPQMLSLSDGESAPNEGVWLAAAMANLCLLATIGGWKFGRRRPSATSAKLATVNFDRLVVACLLLTGFGAVMRFMIGEMADDVRAASQWTGPITILAFFSQVSRLSLALSAILLAYRRTPATIALIAANVVTVLPAILVYGRRGEIVTIAIVGALAIWFVWRRPIPRLLVLAVIPLATLVVHSIAELRGISYGVNEYGQIVTKNRGLDDFASIDFIGNFPLYNPARASELRNAAFEMQAVSMLSDYDFGASLWNALVGLYVPGQIIGFENKEALKIGVSTAALTFSTLQYVGTTGATSTGFADSFRMFWLFGAVLFFINAAIMGRFYESGLRGDVLGQMLYMATMINALQSVTHFSTHFLTALPFFWVTAHLTLRATSARGLIPLSGGLRHRRATPVSPSRYPALPERK